MQQYLGKIVVGLGVVGLMVGIASTYERYRGTELSRVPGFGSAAMAQQPVDAVQADAGRGHS